MNNLIYFIIGFFVGVLSVLLALDSVGLIPEFLRRVEEMKDPDNE